MQPALVQLGRSITIAALLLFAAAQTLEQSHWHDHVDPLCAVCTHADGNDALAAEAPALEASRQSSATAPDAATNPPALTPFYRHGPRAPPHALI